MDKNWKNIEKKELRKKIRDKYALCPKEELSVASVNIMSQFEKLPMFRDAKTLVLYWSDQREVQTHDFILKWALYKTILLPVVVGDSLILKKFAGIENMSPGCFGILEPDQHCDIFPKEKYVDIDMIMVPGVGFDCAGHRLGRGKGYYDRLLPFLNAVKVGVCFGFQLVDTIPVEPHDAVMDIVLSDKK